jgi:hypothetical protein
MANALVNECALFFSSVGELKGRSHKILIPKSRRKAIFCGSHRHQSSGLPLLPGLPSA